MVFSRANRAADGTSGEPVFRLSPQDGSAWVSLDRWQKPLRLLSHNMWWRWWPTRLMTTCRWCWQVRGSDQLVKLQGRPRGRVQTKGVGRFLRAVISDHLGNELLTNSSYFLGVHFRHSSRYFPSFPTIPHKLRECFQQGADEESRLPSCARGCAQRPRKPWLSFSRAHRESFLHPGALWSQRHWAQHHRQRPLAECVGRCASSSPSSPSPPGGAAADPGEA